jgi:hypothetical protein
MGWTTTADYERYNKGLFTIREYLDRQFASDHPNYPRHEIIDSSLHGRTEYYAAMRSTDRDTGKATVFALIAMVSYKPHDPDGYTLGWKEMSEASLPYLFNCPERILKFLDPPHNENAAEWRQRCREHHAKKHTASKAFQDGTAIRFEKPLTFRGGVERQQFTVEKHGRKLRFRAEDGVLCQIPKAATRAFEVIEATA